MQPRCIGSGTIEGLGSFGVIFESDGLFCPPRFRAGIVSPRRAVGRTLRHRGRTSEAGSSRLVFSERRQGKVSLEHHSLPDPYIVAIKAAVGFSAVTGATFMPTGPEPNADDASSDGAMKSTQHPERSLWASQNTTISEESLVRSFGQRNGPSLSP